MAELFMQFGTVVDPIEKQLNAQGYTLGKYAKTFQKISDGIEIAYVYGMFTERELDRVENKYIKQVKKYMKPLKEGDA